MKIYAFFNIPNWKRYSNVLLDYYYNVHDYDYNSIADDRENNFLKILRREKLKELLPDLVDYFDSIDRPIVFLETIGMPYTEDPYSEIHKDASPLFDDYYMADYAINFPLENTEYSKLILFDDEQNELLRINYDHSPILFRTNYWHSVINHSKKLRLTASIRFYVNTSMEEYL